MRDKLTFYLELDGAVTSRPMLQCEATEYLKVDGISNLILLAKLRCNEIIKWPNGTLEIDVVALTGRGADVKRIDREKPPFTVAVHILKNGLLKNGYPKTMDDLLHIARGEIYIAIPNALRNTLGYH